MPENPYQPANDQARFWRACCERGITICPIPKPMREDEQAWLVEKHRTFVDRVLWDAAHTFDSLDDVLLHVSQYLATGVEPTSRAQGRP
jgi:hypothetical protein